MESTARNIRAHFYTLIVLGALLLLGMIFTEPAQSQVAPDSLPPKSSVESIGSELYFFCEYGVLRITSQGYQVDINAQVPPEEIQDVAGRYVGVFCATSVNTVNGETHSLLGYRVFTGDQIQQAQRIQQLNKGRRSSPDSSQGGGR